MVTIERNPGGKGWVLQTELWVPRPAADVFAVFADAYQLEAITPPWLHFHVITPRPIAIERGTLIDYRLRVHGIPIRWQSEITGWGPPFRFVDEQRRGPYRKWRHEHMFEEHDGETLCRDRVEYDVLGGAPVHWFVARDLRRIFEYRRKVFPEVLEASIGRREP